MATDASQWLDREFARFAASGDPGALASVFDATARELLRVARYLTGDAHAAEDAVQATFLVAIEQRTRHEAGRPVLPWLVGILTNRVHTQRRSERRARARARASDATPEEPGTAAERAELRRDLADACARLPDPYRQVLQLHVEHGLSGAEIARVLRRSPDTVRAQIARGLARLRRLLPKGVGLALVLGAVSRRSLAALRARVLLAAGGDPALLSLPISASWLGGALLVNKTKTSLLVATLLLVPLGALALTMDASGDTSDGAEASVVAATPSHAAPATELPPATPSLLERRAAEPALEAGSIHVRLRWTDGTPAAGRGVRVVRWAGWGSDPRTLVSDERGECRLDRAAPGRYTAYAMDGGSKSLAVVSGQVASTDFELARWATVEGRVVDSNGTPVAGAEIVNLGDPSDHEGWVGGRSNDAGGFAVTLGGKDQAVAARAKGHAPSFACRYWPVLQGERRSVTLRLRGVAGGVRGRVVDTENRPVAGARIQVERQPAAPPPDEPGASWRDVPVESYVDAGADGSFAIEMLPPGPIDVRARASGLAAASERVQVPAGGTTEVLLHLPPAFQVAGIVTDAAGRPVEGVDLLASAPSRFCRPVATSDANGAFLVEGVAAGSVRIAATKWEAGRVVATLDIGDRPVTAWNPVLGSGPAIRGRLVDDLGQPLAGWRVNAFHPSPDSKSPRPGRIVGHVRTDAAGRFVHHDLEPVAHTIEIFDTAAKSAVFASFAFADVLPGAPERTFTIPRAEQATVVLRGTVLDRDGSRLDGAWVGFGTGEIPWLSNGEERFPLDVHGAFEIGPRKPDTHRLTLHLRDDTKVPLGVFRTRPHEVVDLGIVRLPAPSTIDVRVLGLDDQPIRLTLLHVSTALGDHVTHTSVENGLARLQLHPGRYRLRTAPGGAGFIVRPIEVAPGASQSVLLRARDGRTVTVRFPDVAEKDSHRMAVELRRADGTVCDVCCPSPYRGMVCHRWQLPPGSYTLTGQGPDGRRFQAGFVVGDDDSQTVDVRATR